MRCYPPWLSRRAARSASRACRAGSSSMLRDSSKPRRPNPRKDANPVKPRASAPSRPRRSCRPRKAWNCWPRGQLPLGPLQCCRPELGRGTKAARTRLPRSSPGSPPRWPTLPVPTSLVPRGIAPPPIGAAWIAATSIAAAPLTARNEEGSAYAARRTAVPGALLSTAPVGPQAAGARALHLQRHGILLCLRRTHSDRDALDLAGRPPHPAPPVALPAPLALSPPRWATWLGERLRRG